MTASILEPMLRLEGVTREYGGAPPTVALGDVTFSVDPGEYVAVVGPSGSGKSTLLNIIGLLDRPSAGTYYLQGMDTSSLVESERSSIRARTVGFVFQSFHLLWHRSIEENVMLAEMYRRDLSGSRYDRAVRALDLVGLSHKVSRTPEMLSGGERQRVAIARAIVGSPSLLLCDEPTGNLDQATGHAILELLDSLHQSGQTIMIITHDPLVAARASASLSLRDGRLVK